eukprot:389742-Alexandrium_andersonii.AAC.1
MLEDTPGASSEALGGAALELPASAAAAPPAPAARRGEGAGSRRWARRVAQPDTELERRRCARRALRCRVRLGGRVR